MSDYSQDAVWARIVSNAGETFHTVRGRAFTYAVEGNELRTDRTDYLLSRGNFERPLAVLPVDGPGEFGKEVRGASYVFAILTDIRIVIGGSGISDIAAAQSNE
jgi:hypothetical protein